MNIFILTGAGISAESGLTTFRGNDGLWKRHSPFELATPQAFARDPDLVQDFYNARRRALLDAAPNPAHMALARLEANLTQVGGTLLICTQNVDDLHERAASGAVLHMHGELRKARCVACSAINPWDEDLARLSVCPSCSKPGSLRPHVVWFGEMPLHMESIEAALAAAALFVAIGTSATVHPAAGFADIAREVSARTPLCQ
jgi:NAD-dependent deacetylase